MKSFYISLVSLVPLSTAAALSRRADFCGQWDTATAGPYTVYNNLWGESAASSGSQCTGVDSISGSTIAWHTSWSWAGGPSSVKSFANVALQFTIPALADVKSIPTTWKWEYTGSSIDADVAYDMFLSSTASTDGTSEYEIMVWLAALGGAGPIGGSIATVDIAGVTWSLHSGLNGAMQVFSFVASSETQNFQGDLADFFTYLQENQGVSSSLYLTHVQAGTEPFTGSDAELTTSSYSVSVESGSGTTPPSSTTTTTSRSTTTTSPTSSATGTAQHWGQCGGTGWTGPTACVSPYTCQVQNPWYSQCL